MGHARCAMLVDEMAGDESSKGEGCIEGMGLVVGDSVSVDPAGTGRGLVASSPPSSVELQPIDRRLVDDGTGVVACGDRAAPLAHEPKTAKYWEHLND